MIKNLIKNSYKFIFIFIISILLNFSFAFAQGTDEVQTTPAIKKGIGGFIDNLNPLAQNVGYQTENVSVESMVGRTIQLIISFLGILFLILIIVSGIQWMFAGGNEEVIDKSKQRIKNATFGLAIILAAYAVTLFITSLLIEKTGFTK